MNELSYTANPKVGFPHYVTVGHLWWKKKVPYGWEDRGPLPPEKKPFTNQYYNYDLEKWITHEENLEKHTCGKTKHIGKEGREYFIFCPHCLIASETRVAFI